MVKNRIKVSYFIFWLLFILYLARANDIVLGFEDVKTQKINFGDLQRNSEVYCSLDSCEYIGGVLENVYFQGWAYCETEYDNEDKQINLIFKSIDSDLCYRVQNNAQSRDDVYGAFRDEKKIYNGMNGVECQFSTVDIKEGIYEYYVEVIENEYNYGIKNTGLKLCKTGNEFVFVEE